MQVEIPTGLPLIYDVNNKCIRLLDDGSGGQDPTEKYNFGTAADLLFGPAGAEHTYGVGRGASAGVSEVQKVTDAAEEGKMADGAVSDSSSSGSPI